MNFRDEYKKEITELSSDETARRIRESVMARLEKSEQSEPSAPEAPVKKKPLPIKRIAVVGGSIAACLVIGFTALAVNNKSGYIFPGDMAPNENMAGNPGSSGGAGEHSRPQNITGGNNTIAAEGSSADTEQPSGGLWDNTASDGGNVGGNTGRDPTNNAPASVPDADSTFSQGGEPDYTDPGGGALVITFEDDGFTLGSGGRIQRFSPAENADGIGTTLSPDDLGDYMTAETAEQEQYIIMTSGDEFWLLNDKLEVMGIYVYIG